MPSKFRIRRLALSNNTRSPSSSPSPAQSPSPSKRLSNPRNPHRDPPPRTISLLEELFPRRTQPNPPTHEPRSIPRRPIDAEITYEDRIASARRQILTERKSSRGSSEDVRARQREGTAALVLERARRGLDEGDFRSVVPGGRHIERWTSVESGDLVRVIRLRNASTMEPTSSYFILFTTPESAQLYLSNITKLHRMATSHFPATFTRSIPPSDTPETDDEYAQLRRYALVPPSQDLQIRMVYKPFKPFIRRILENGGYDPFVKNRLSEHEVVVSTEARMSLRLLKDAINKDGKERGLAWDMVDDRHAVREVRLLRSETQGAFTKSKADSRTAADADQGQTGDAYATSVQNAREGHLLRKFIVALQSLDEAKRFVLMWHRRDITTLLPELHSSEEAPVVDAERIW